MLDDVGEYDAYRPDVEVRKEVVNGDLGGECSKTIGWYAHLAYAHGQAPTHFECRALRLHFVESMMR